MTSSNQNILFTGRNYGIDFEPNGGILIYALFRFIQITFVLIKHKIFNIEGAREDKVVYINIVSFKLKIS